MNKEQQEQMNNFYQEQVKTGLINNLDGAVGFKIGYEKAFSLHSVSQRTWNSAEIINELYQFETIDEAKRWFREYGG